MSDFATRLLHWYDRHGRHDLPWQQSRSPYRVWVAEVMLQQTQVVSAIPFFQRFMARFPDLPTLAAAPLDAVLAAWSGLGYYARARNLHAAAQRCVRDHHGALPDTRGALEALPGIGRSTAAAILAQAHGHREAILDGNVKRVLCRRFGIAGQTAEPAVARALWALADSLLPHDRLADYTQAQMDLGATLCTPRQPACERCPLRSDCMAHRDGRVDALPSPKPRRSVPACRCVVLVLRDPQRRVLLQRRAEQGVWGGLWSLPQFEQAEQAMSWLDGQSFAQERFERPAPSPLLHRFTHFHLRIEPRVFDLRRVVARVAEHPAESWFADQDCAAAGIPQPIRKILDKLWSPTP